MIRGTSVPVPMRVLCRHLEDSPSVLVSITQGRYRLDKTDVTVVPDGCDSIVTVPFTVEETLALREGTADIQITWLDAMGYQHKTKTVAHDILRTIYEGEL